MLRFQAFHSFISIGEFAMEAALPAPCVVPDITKDELVEIVRLAMTAGWPNDIYYRNLFDSNVPMPGASGLLFYPEDWKAGQDLSKYDPTPQDIVKRATAPGRRLTEQLPYPGQSLPPGQPLADGKRSALTVGGRARQEHSQTKTGPPMPVLRLRGASSRACPSEKPAQPLPPGAKPGPVPAPRAPNPA